MRIARVVFARVPDLNFSNTRLAADFGAVDALALERWLLRVQMRVLAVPIAQHRVRDHIFFAPRTTPFKARLKFRNEFPRVRLHFHAQSEGDLGKRYHAALAKIFEHHDLALIWGGDMVALPGGVFDTAVALSPQSVVTPARGGTVAFFSLAAEKFSPALFEHIRWHTPHAFGDQVRAFQNNGIAVVQRGKAATLHSAHNLPRIIRSLEAEARDEDLRDLARTVKSFAR